jgi:tetratricopeptide (TPR) repeat protein
LAQRRHLKARVAALLVACLLAPPFATAQTLPPPAGYTEVGPDTARHLGLQAIKLNRPDIAAEIAAALLQQDPTDTFAHFLMATSLMRLGQTETAELAAKQSYRYAQSPEQSYQSAQLAANLAFARGALTTAQWWLRKSAEAAPDDARKDKAVAQFRAVRARNPWRIKFALSLRPSDNVNNGSSGQFNIIDGLPYVGTLSQDAQAVKGVVADVALSLGRRLSQSPTRETHLGLELSKRHVTLSGTEKARLGGDPGFGAQRGVISLRQDWRPAQTRHLFSLEGGIGRQTYQSGGSFSFAQLSLGHRMPLATFAALETAVEVEQRTRQAGRQAGLRGDRSFALRSTLIHLRDNQDIVTATALANRFDTALDGRSSTTLGLQLGYALAKPIGPVGLSVTFGAQKSRFDGYSLAGMVVPGGRADMTSYAELQMQIDDLSFTGFSPVLRLRHQRTTSNVSRFEAQETSVVLGIASKF